jgi:hypothetical protein
MILSIVYQTELIQEHASIGLGKVLVSFEVDSFKTEVYIYHHI